MSSLLRTISVAVVAGALAASGSARGAGPLDHLKITAPPAPGVHALAACFGPFTLSASPTSVPAGQQFVLSWCDPSFYISGDASYGVNSYSVYASLSPSGGFSAAATGIPAGATAVQVGTQASDAGTTLYLFVRALGTNVTVAGPAPLNKDSNVVSVTLTGSGSSTCTGDSTSLCLFGNRFKATATFMRYGSSAVETATAHGYSDTTGFFSTVLASDVDVVVKMVNFCSLNGSWSAYIGGTTDLEVDITIVDTSNGHTYHATNALGNRWLLIRDTAFTCP